MRMFLLQDLGLGNIVPVEKLDSIDVHGQIHKVAETLQSSTPEQIFHYLLDAGLHFCHKFLAAILIYIIGAWVIRRIKKLLAIAFNKRGVDRSVSSFVQSLVSFVLTLVLIVVTISTLGVNTTSLAAVLAALAMALGMSLSGAMSNFAGGVLILIFHPFRSGDFIEAMGISGYVDSISIFNTKIITPDNKIVYVPNGAISNGTIWNYNKNQTRRVEWRVSTAYGTDVEQMRKVCLDILGADKRILTAEDGMAAPSCNVMSLKDSSVEFVVRCWVRSDDYWDVFFEINNAIYTTLPKEGIQFPFPQLDVHVKQ